MSLTLLITQSFLISELLLLTILLLPFAPQKLTIALPRPVHHLIYALVMLIAFSFADSLYRRSYQQYFYLNGITLFLFLILKRMLNVVNKLKREEMEVSVMRRQIENHKKFVMEMVEENKKLREENEGLRSRVVLDGGASGKNELRRGIGDSVARNRIADGVGVVSTADGPLVDALCGGAQCGDSTMHAADEPPAGAQHRQVADAKNDSRSSAGEAVREDKGNVPVHDEENEDENWGPEW